MAIKAKGSDFWTQLYRSINPLVDAKGNTGFSFDALNPFDATAQDTTPEDPYKGIEDMVNKRYDLGQTLLGNKLSGLENRRQADLTVQLGRQGNLNGGIAEGAKNQITQNTQGNLTTGLTNLESSRLQTLANLKMKSLDMKNAQSLADSQAEQTIMQLIGTVGGFAVGGAPGAMVGGQIAGSFNKPEDIYGGDYANSQWWNDNGIFVD